MGSVRGKLTAIFVAIGVITTFIVGGYFIYEIIAENDANNAEYRKQLEEQYDREIRLQTEGLVSSLNGIYERQKAGELTEAQAKSLAIEVMKAVRYDDGKGYFFADEKDSGICIAHATLHGKVEGKMRQNDQDSNGVYYMQEIFKAALSSPNGGYSNFSFPKPGETQDLPKRGYSMEFKPYGWIICTGSWIDYIDAAAADHAKVANEELHRKIITSCGILVVLIVLMIIAGVKLAAKFADPISFVTGRMKSFADGNFKQEPIDPSYRSNDELGQMIDALSELGANTRKLINAIKSSAEEVAKNAAGVNEMTEQSAAASNQIAESITDVAGSTNSQLSAVDDASTAVTELAERIDAVSENAEKAAKETTQATETAHNGNKVVEHTVNDMERLSEVVGESAKMVNNLGERSDTIGKITGTISGIAEQTNLLALNAAIEAARAGEAGRGFAVVADEIRKLATQSDEAANQISSLISQIQSETERAVRGMQEGTEQLKATRSSVEETGKEFQLIVNLVETIAERSRQIAEASKSAAGNAESCQSAIENIGEMSRSVVSNSETVSAASEEQAASVHEMATSCQQLSETAKTLLNEVAKFKV